MSFDYCIKLNCDAKPCVDSDKDHGMWCNGEGLAKMKLMERNKALTAKGWHCVNGTHICPDCKEKGYRGYESEIVEGRRIAS